MSNTRLLRRLAIAFGLVAVVLVAAAVAFVASFDVNRYKSDIVQAVHTQTGRTLLFDGDLAVTVFPSIGIRLPATTLSERAGDTPFAQLASARASVALLPLLRGQLRVDAVRIDGLKATIEKRPDGGTNVDDLLRRDTTPAEPSRKQTASRTTASIDEVELRGADLTYRDGSTRRTVRLANLNLSAGRYAPGARMPVEATAEVGASEPAVAAKVALDVRIEWAADGSLAGVHELTLKADGRWNERPMMISVDAKRLLVAGATVDVRELKAVATTTTPQGPLEVRLTSPQLAVSAEHAQGDRIEASAVRGGANPLELTLAISDLRGNAAALEAGSVKLTGQTRAGERRIAIDAVTPLKASLERRTARIERATINVVVEDPALPQKSARFPLVLTAAIDGQREFVSAELDSEAEGLTGHARVELEGFERRRVNFDIDAREIDVDRYFPAQKATPSPGGVVVGKAPAASASKGGAAADAPVDLSALRELSGGGSLRVGRLRAREFEANEVRMTAKAADGRIELAPVSARVYGGGVSGRVGIDARANRVSTQGEVAGIDLRRAVGKVSPRFGVEGSTSGTFELAAAGMTVPQMKRNLNGRVALTVRNGAILGIDLDDMVGSAGGFLLSRGRQSGAIDERKRTEFTQLTGSARITDGVAVNEDLKAQTKQLNVTGSGRLDLAAEQLDYTLRAQVAAVPAGSLNALRSLTGVTVPVHVSGPLDRLAYSIDWGSVAAEVALRRAAGPVRGPAVNQMIEGLGGLLKRGNK